MRLSSFPSPSNRFSILLVVVIAALLYGNSINNEYGPDDNLVVEGNERVAKGILGIPELFVSRYAISEKQEFGYRPLVLASFALEQSFFGELPASQTIEEKAHRDLWTQANISHLINVVLYACNGILLLYFLGLLFPAIDRRWLLGTLVLFMIHPMHTEVVNNLKSRDELMAFLGIIGSLMFFIRYGRSNRLHHLLMAAIVAVLAFLCKETALVLLFLVPLTLWFVSDRPKPVLVSSTVMVLVFMGFLASRKLILGDGGGRVFAYYENPLFIEGNLIDRVQVGVYAAWFYLRQLVIPYDFSFYYGYPALSSLSSHVIWVWLAVIIYLGMLVWGWKKLRQRHPLGYALFLWLGILFGYLNILSPVVGVIADRFVYLQSVGFSLFVVLGCKHLMNAKRNGLKIVPVPVRSTIVTTVLVLCVALTWSRNENWENRLVLYTNDVGQSNHSAKGSAMLANEMENAAKRAADPKEKIAYIREAEFNYQKSIELYPDYVNSYNNLGSIAFDYYGDLDRALTYFDQAIERDSTYIESWYNGGRVRTELKQHSEAVRYYQQVIDLQNAHGGFEQLLRQSYSYLHYHYVALGRMVDAFNMNQSAIEQFPGEAEFHLNLGGIHLSGKDTLTGIQYFEQAYQIDPMNKKLILLLSELHGKIGNYDRSALFRAKL